MTTENYPQIIHTDIQSIIKLSNKTAVLCERNPLITIYTDDKGATCGLSIKYDDTNEKNLLRMIQEFTITCNLGHTGISMNTTTPNNMAEEVETYNNATKQ